MTSGVVWSTGLIANSRRPYEKLYDKILKAVEKLNDGIADINEVWTERKEEEADNADI